MNYTSQKQIKKRIYSKNEPQSNPTMRGLPKKHGHIKLIIMHKACTRLIMVQQHYTYGHNKMF